jgi:RND superfamily putative drug exporter
VARVLRPGLASDRLSVALAVHLESDLSPEHTSAIGDQLREQLDPGLLALAVGGSEATQEAVRAVALDEASLFLGLGLALVAIVLSLALGLRPALAALLGAALAAATTLAILGALGELITIEAVSAVGAALLAVVLAIELAAGLLFRYRVEAATLGGGPEALEYSLHNLLNGAAIAALSAAAVGVALLAVPVDFLRSVGLGIILAALLGPGLGTLPMAALLLADRTRQIGEALPLVSGEGPTGGGPLTFRALVAIGRRRRYGLLALPPLIATAALALPLLDSQAVGLDPAALPPDQEAAAAGAEIAAAYGPGANGPLQVVLSQPTDLAAVAAYRGAVEGRQRIESVAEPRVAGPLTAFDATPVPAPQSLGAQDAVEEIEALTPPGPQGLAGPAAELRDTADRVGGDLPLFALAALLAVAALWSMLLRSAFGPLLVLSALTGPLAGVAAMIAVFGQGRLTGLLDYTDAGAAHLQPLAIVAAVLLALGLARAAESAAALREERLLGAGAAGSLARSGLLTLLPALASTIAGLLLVEIWLGSDLLVAKELALGLGAGLAADLLIARTVLAPALARLAL